MLSTTKTSPFRAATFQDRRAVRGIWTTPFRTPVAILPLTKSPPFRTSGTLGTSAITRTERSPGLTDGLMWATFPSNSLPGNASVENRTGCPTRRAAISVEGTLTVSSRRRLSTRRKTTFCISPTRSPSFTIRSATVPSKGERITALERRVVAWTTSSPATATWALAAAIRAAAASFCVRASSIPCRVSSPDSCSLTARSYSRSARATAASASSCPAFAISRAAFAFWRRTSPSLVSTLSRGSPLRTFAQSFT